MANSIIKYYTDDNKARAIFNSSYKDESGNALTVVSNGYVESEGCCVITLSGELSTIDNFLFKNNTGGVTSVIFPEGLKNISNHCLFEIGGLKTVEFPTTIEKIGQNTFSSCSSLKKLVFNGTVPPNAYCAFSGFGSNGVLYRPSGADYSTVLNGADPDNPGAYVPNHNKLSNYGWVERVIGKELIETTLLVNDLPTSIGVGRYVDIRPVTNSDGVISIILNGEEVGTVNSGDTYSLQIPKEGTNKILIKIEVTDSYTYYANEYTIIGIETSLDFTVEGNPNYEGNELSITPTTNSDGSIVVTYIKNGSSTIIGTCHTNETIKWTVPSIGKYTIKCDVFETPIYNGKTITKEYESSEKEYPNITIKVNGYDLNGDKTSEPYFVGYTLKIYAYKNGSIIFDDEYSVYVNGVALQGYEYKVTEAGELNIKVVVPSTDTSYEGTAFTTVNVESAPEGETNTLIYTTTDNTKLSFTNVTNDNNEGCYFFNHVFENGIGTITFTDKQISNASVMFKNLSTLKTVKLPSKLKKIPYQCFYGCTYLESFDNFKQIEQFGDKAFYGCTSLKGTVELPMFSKYSTLPEDLFAGCSSIETLIVPFNVEPRFVEPTTSSPSEELRFLTYIDECTSLKNIYWYRDIDCDLWYFDFIRYLKEKNINLHFIRPFQGYHNNILMSNAGLVYKADISSAEERPFKIFGKIYDGEIITIKPVKKGYKGIIKYYLFNNDGIINEIGECFEGDEFKYKLNFSKRFVSSRRDIIYKRESIGILAYYENNDINKYLPVYIPVFVSDDKAERGIEDYNVAYKTLGGVPISLSYVYTYEHWSEYFSTFFHPFATDSDENHYGYIHYFTDGFQMVDKKFPNVYNLWYNGNNITELILPDDIWKTIQDEALSGFESLTQFTIPHGIKHLGRYVFKNNTNLKRLDIKGFNSKDLLNPDSFEAFSFYGCSNLEIIVLHDDSYTPYFEHNGTSDNIHQFEGVKEYGTLYVKKGNYRYDWLNTDKHWLGYYHWNLIEYDDDDKAITYTTTDNNMLILDTDKLPEIESHTFENGKGIIVFKEILTDFNPSKNDRPFFGQSTLKTINLPDTLYDLSIGAFLRCSNLESVSIGSGLKYIGIMAFTQCSKLESIYISTVLEPKVYSWGNGRVIEPFEPANSPFIGVKEYGNLFMPTNADYSNWLSDTQYYLGYYHWNYQEGYDKNTNFLVAPTSFNVTYKETDVISNAILRNVKFSHFDNTTDWLTPTFANNKIKIHVAKNESWTNDRTGTITFNAYDDKKRYQKDITVRQGIDDSYVLELDRYSDNVNENEHILSYVVTTEHLTKLNVSSDSEWAEPVLNNEWTNLTVTVNSLPEDVLSRTAKITLSGTVRTGAYVTKTLKITQIVGKITIDPSVISVNYERHTVSSIVNYEYIDMDTVEFSTNVYWLTPELSLDKKTLTVMVKSNTNIPRKGIVTVKCTSLAGEEKMATLTINQSQDKNIKIVDGLYIEGNKVDIQENVKVAMTFESVNTENPEAVKNSYSKTVDIYGTNNNNKIFADVWKLDRSIVKHSTIVSGINFNPKKRVEFIYYENGDIIERGYISLDNITVNKGVIKYSITLYGGLGDFFYGIMYKEDGEEMTLANLYYGFTDADGNKYTKDKEDNDILITWNKDYILDSWGYLYSGKDHNGNTVPVRNDANMDIKNWIVPVPTYSGLYDDFDNNKVLVAIGDRTYNGRGEYSGTRAGATTSTEYKNAFNTLFPTSQKNESNSAITYTTKYGYGLMELPRDFIEWETRDLRSAYQRPAVRTKLILDAISNPDNNSGYEVKWPDDMFMSGTSLYNYYNYSYILMDRIDFSETTENVSIQLRYPNNTDPVIPSNTFNMETYLWEVGKDDSSAHIFDLSGGYSNPKCELSVSPMFTLNDQSIKEKNIYSCFSTGEYRYQTVEELRGGQHVNAIVTGTHILVGGWVYRLECYTGTGPGDQGVELYSTSPNYFVTSYGDIPYFRKVQHPNGWRKNEGKYRPVKSDINWADFGIDPDTVIMTNNTLNFNQGVTVGWYTYDKPIKLKVDAPANNPNVRFQLVMKYVYGTNVKNVGIPTSFIGCYGTNGAGIELTGVSSRYYTQVPMHEGEDDDEFICGIYNGESSEVQSENCKKKTIFKSTESPFTYLTSFTKLFNLRYRVDTLSKKVIIEKRPDYYQNEVIDITDKIDRSKDVKIYPTTTENKWYSYRLETPETYASKMYYNKYGMEYGEYKVDTGYFFNSDNNDIFEDCIYKNVVDYRLRSPYFNTNKALGTTGYAYPTIGLVPSYKWTLWHTSGSTMEEYSANKYGCQSYATVSKVYDWPKLCCFDRDNANVTELTNALVFFDGTYTSEKPYQISDNLNIMMKLNDNKPCYIYAPVEEGEVINGYISETEQGTICYRLSTLPVFSKNMRNESGVVVSSFDFDVPKALFVDAANYDINSCIYKGYWENYIEDLYDEDAKKVEVYYFLNENPKEAMRKFYFFDNSIWIISKVDDWDPRSKEPTKCTFVKVKSKTNYLS